MVESLPRSPTSPALALLRMGLDRTPGQVWIYMIVFLAGWRAYLMLALPPSALIPPAALTPMDPRDVVADPGRIGSLLWNDPDDTFWSVMGTPVAPAPPGAMLLQAVLTWRSESLPPDPDALKFRGLVTDPHVLPSIHNLERERSPHDLPERPPPPLVAPKAGRAVALGLVLFSMMTHSAVFFTTGFRKHLALTFGFLSYHAFRAVLTPTGPAAAVASALVSISLYAAVQDRSPWEVVVPVACAGLLSHVGLWYMGPLMTWIALRHGGGIAAKAIAATLVVFAITSLPWLVDDLYRLPTRGWAGPAWNGSTSVSWRYLGKEVIESAVFRSVARSVSVVLIVGWSYIMGPRLSRVASKYSSDNPASTSTLVSWVTLFVLIAHASAPGRPVESVLEVAPVLPYVIYQTQSLPTIVTAALIYLYDEAHDAPRAGLLRFGRADIDNSLFLSCFHVAIVALSFFYWAAARQPSPSPPVRPNSPPSVDGETASRSVSPVPLSQLDADGNRRPIAPER